MQTDMQSDNSEVNPYAPPLVSEPPAASNETGDTQVRYRNLWFDGILLLAMTIGCSVATVFVLDRIFNIIPTGGGAVCVGLLMIIREWLCRSRRQAKWRLMYWLGGSLITTTLGFITLINIRGWGPDAAKANHVDWAVVGFAVLFALSGLFAFAIMLRNTGNAKFGRIQGR